MQLPLGEEIAVYEWCAWNDYLLPKILPRARRIAARVGESHTEVLAKLPPTARTFVFHVNLTDQTRVPFGRQVLAVKLDQSGLTVVNGRLVNISKHTVQATCRACRLPVAAVTIDGHPDELLIVKTNRNYGGESEAQLTLDEARLLEQELFPGTPETYQVLPRFAVPASTWADRQSVVERFITNEADVFFRAYVLGDRMVISAAISHLEIKKMIEGLDRRQFYCHSSRLLGASQTKPGSAVIALPAALLHQLRRFCRALHLDYGALDVMMNDSKECFIVDVNATPYWAGMAPDDLLLFLRGEIDKP